MNEQKQADGVKKWYKERNFWITYLVSMVFFIGIGASSNPNQSSTTPTYQQPTEQKPVEDVKPTEVKKPDPIVLSGVGQKATDKFTLKQGLATFKLTHTGSSNFAIDLLDSNGERNGLLVNEIGAFDGSKALRIEKAGEYILDVSADGNWTVNIQQ